MAANASPACLAAVVTQQSKPCFHKIVSDDDLLLYRVLIDLQRFGQECAEAEGGLGAEKAAGAHGGGIAGVVEQK